MRLAKDKRFVAIIDLLAFIAEHSMYLTIGEWTTFFPQDQKSDGENPSRDAAQDARERKIICGATLIQLNRFYLRTFFSPDHSVIV